MPKTTTSEKDETALTVPEKPSALAVVQAVLATIPQADEDPTDRMAAFILSQPAERWEELWAGLPNVKDSAGEVVTVHAIRARESDFEGPLGVYLICDVTWRSTGEKGLLSCSSQMAMLQLITLHRDGKLPATVEIVKKEKATKRGFHPIHLRYIVNPGPEVIQGN